MKIIGKYTLTKRVAKKLKYEKSDCEEIINAFIDEIISSVVVGDNVQLREFLSIKPTIRAERKGKDLNTGKDIIFPAVASVKCTISSHFKEKVKNNLAI